MHSGRNGLLEGGYSIQIYVLSFSSSLNFSVYLLLSCGGRLACGTRYKEFLVGQSVVPETSVSHDEERSLFQKALFC